MIWIFAYCRGINVYRWIIEKTWKITVTTVSYDRKNIIFIILIILFAHFARKDMRHKKWDKFVGVGKFQIK